MSRGRTRNENVQDIARAFWQQKFLRKFERRLQCGSSAQKL